MFSEKTQQILAMAGWSQNYQYDVSQYREIFSLAKCEVPAVILDFLQTFGGLVLYYPHKVTKASVELSLNPLKEIENLRLDICSDLNEYAYRAEVSKLFPIGSFANRHMLLMMAPDSRVYAAYDEFFVQVSETGIEAIEAICNGRDFVEIT